MTGKLLWITQHYFPQTGGMAQSCDRIVSGLRRRGWHVDLIHINSRWPSLQVYQRHNGSDLLCPLDVDISHSLNRLWCSLPQLGTTQYQALVAFGGPVPLLAGPVFSAWLQLPLVTLIRGNDFDAAVFDPRRMDTLERALRASTRVAAVSQDKVDKIRHLWPEVNAEWIANGIELERWQAIDSDILEAQKLRRHWIQQDVQQVLGLFGHIKPKKGGDYFIEALARSGNQHKTHLLIVGEMDPALQAMLQPVESQTPPFTFTHIPFGDRYGLLPYYLACDFVCIPSYYDGMPNVMLEAAALGIPLLAAQVGGMADVLINHRHGFMFPPGDIDACAAAIRHSVDLTPLQRQQMTDACRSLVQEQLNAAQELDRYETLLTSLPHSQRHSQHLKLV